MKIVILFAPNFCLWAKDIVLKMREGCPELEVIGVTTNSDTYKQVKAFENFPLREIYDLSALEQGWLDARVSNEDLAELERSLGADVLLKTVIADKTLSSGWFNGAETVDTRLGKIVKQDKQALKNYIAGLFQFYCELFEREKPDLTFLYAVAGGPSFALAKVSQHYGCEFRRFLHSRIQNFYILDASETGQLSPVRELLDAAQKNPKLLQDARQQARAWLDEFRKTKSQPSYFVSNRQHQLKTQKWSFVFGQMAGVGWRSCKHLLSRHQYGLREKPEAMHFLNKVLLPLRKKYSWNRKYYESFDAYKDTPYVLFPLHVEPEAATLVMAPYHCNQLAVIEALSRSVPLSSVILVKEHPTMAGKRPASFYKTLKRMPNVVLIDPFDVTHDMISKADLVATITGTVGWEAMLMGRRVLVMGDAPYLNVQQGFVHCPSLAALPEAIEDAFTLKLASDDALIDFVAAIMSVGLNLCDDILWRYQAKHSQEYAELTAELAGRLLSCADIAKPAKKRAS